MGTKVLPFFLLLLLVSCTTKQTSTDRLVNQKWQQTIEQITALKESKNTAEENKLLKQKLPEILQDIENTNEKDSLMGYLREILDLRLENDLQGEHFEDKIRYMDSISQNPFLKEHCQYELLSSRASLNQINGNNKEAIELADEYMKLPTNPDANRFIREAEIVSNTYIFSGNNIPKAIEICERAVEAYHKGAKYSQMLRLISRLGLYYHSIGKYEKAIATNQEVISSYNDSLSPQNVVIAYGEQANIYTELGMYRRALEMNEKAQYYSIKQDSFALGDIYRYRAAIFRKTGEKDSVFHYLRLGEKVSALKGTFKGVFINKVIIADAYLDYPDSVQKALQITLSVCKDSTRVPQWAKHQLNLHLGRALLLSGQDHKGIQLIEQAAQGLFEMDMTEGHEANKILMSYYLSKGMSEDFARCHARNEILADSLENIEKMRAVAAANIQFDTQQKEKENKLLAEQVKMEQQQTFYYVCISIVLLIILIITIGYFTKRRKANRLLIEKNKHEIENLITRQQDLHRRNEQLIEQIEQAMATNKINTVRQLTVQTLLSKDDENEFRQSFATIYPSYLPKLREHYPQLTRNEELLAMLICINQSTDEIALIMGINRNSVNVVRSRMRKNMELTKEDSLDDVLKQYLS